MWKSQLPHLGTGSDSEPSHTDRSDSEISEQSNTDTTDRPSRSNKTPNANTNLGNPGVNKDTDDLQTYPKVTVL